MKLLIFIFLLLLGCQAKKEQTGTDKTQYTCAMHPQVITSEPGLCPICHMTLTPILKTQAAITQSNTHSVHLSEAVKQSLNIKIEKAELRELGKEFKGSGTVEIPENQVELFTLKTDAWIEKMVVNKTGQNFLQDQILFEIYSPELISLQTEYLSAINISDEQSLKILSEKLLIFGLTEKQIKTLDANKFVNKITAIYAKSASTILEKLAINGQKIDKGMPIYKVAKLDPLWVTINLYDQAQNFIRIGDKVELKFNNMHTILLAKIDWISPVIDEQSKTLKVRVTLPKQNAIKANQIVIASVKTNAKKVLSLSESSVLWEEKGARAVKILDPNTVQIISLETGFRQNGFIEIISGLSLNDEVVANAQFLLDSESQIKMSLEQFNSNTVHQH